MVPLKETNSWMVFLGVVPCIMPCICLHPRLSERFFAPWCSHCKSMAKETARIGSIYSGDRGARKRRPTWSASFVWFPPFPTEPMDRPLFNLSGFLVFHHFPFQPVNLLQVEVRLSLSTKRGSIGRSSTFKSSVLCSLTPHAPGIFLEACVICVRCVAAWYPWRV